jgi:DNA ligase-1
LKLKDFETEEFEITGFTDGKGKEEGLIIYILKTKKGKQFLARPEGTEEERAELFKNGTKLIGKMVTVKFMEITPDGVPRMPVALGIREYE